MIWAVMAWVALSWALTMQPVQPASYPQFFYGGRLYTSGRLHVGLRPAAYVDNEGDGSSIEVGLGATLQVSVLSIF